MKKVLVNLTLAAAALVVASTVASAADLRAEIPFRFQSGNTVMEPGTYLVVGHEAGRWFRLYNEHSRKSLTLIRRSQTDAPSAWRHAGKPILEFACTDGRCTPKRIWTGEETSAHEFANPKTEEEKPTRLALIRLTAAGGE
ncbi:MAG: hypothetical protein C5B51_16435 [Terriglobia bacterium]|nr:MAG: hypothetical protein C5B51_16435 [Terriglobia bacterium]